MKAISPTLLRALALYFSALNAAAKLHSIENVKAVGEIDENTTFSPDGNEIFFKDSADSPFEIPLRCKADTGKQLTYTADRKFVSCCLPGQSLLGSLATAFECCGARHELAGDKTVGFTCCPTGQKYDGVKCRPCDPPTPPVCQNGKVLKDGMCVCPTDAWEENGVCVPTHPSPPPGPSPPPAAPQRECTSGIEAGKCYTWTFPNGERFGYNARGWYTASKESRHQQFGKFKLCKDQKCTPGPINPGEGFSAQDLHGNANGGQNAGWYVDGKINGDHVSKTADYAKSGRFTLTKWPCGKYCLGGLEAGFGPTCPSDLPAGTFTTHDKQSCIPIDVLEVPCDVHNIANNCIWHNGANQCCDKVDCSPAAQSRTPAAAASNYKTEL